MGQYVPLVQKVLSNECGATYSIWCKGMMLYSSSCRACVI